MCIEREKKGNGASETHGGGGEERERERGSFRPRRNLLHLLLPVEMTVGRGYGSSLHRTVVKTQSTERVKNNR